MRTDYIVSEAWRKLSEQQLGAYAEYFVKMQFTRHGFSVYSPEIDDRSVDFVVTTPSAERFYRVQVKSMRGPGYDLQLKNLHEVD